MKFFRPTIRFSALLLLVLTVHVIAHSLLLPKYDPISLQEQSVSTASFTTAIDGDGETHRDDFKPPKHSFIDYSAFFSPHYFLPVYNPVVSKLLPHEPFRTLQKVYFEINVPPDSLTWFQLRSTNKRHCRYESASCFTLETTPLLCRLRLRDDQLQVIIFAALANCMVLRSRDAVWTRRDIEGISEYFTYSCCHLLVKRYGYVRS